MNILIVVLGIVVVFLCYYIYQMYTTGTTSADNTYLGKISDPNVPQTIAPDVFKDPYSSKYTVAFWVYVNTFSPDIKEFLNYGTPTTSMISFILDANKPILTTKVKIGQLTGDTQYQTIQITDNLPIQSWVYVMISVNSSYADCYLNGKLVVSQQLSDTSSSIAQSSNKDAAKPTINLYGGRNVDVYITRVTRVSTPTDPQTAWDYYNKGNGNASGAGDSSMYHLDVNISKDSENWKYKIF